MEPDTEWRAISPGVLELPGTKYRIEYVGGSMQPFRATWDGQRFLGDVHSTLDGIKKNCFSHMAEMITMGFAV